MTGALAPEVRRWPSAAEAAALKGTCSARLKPCPSNTLKRVVQQLLGTWNSPAQFRRRRPIELFQFCFDPFMNPSGNQFRRHAHGILDGFGGGIAVANRADPF